MNIIMLSSAYLLFLLSSYFFFRKQEALLSLSSYFRFFIVTFPLASVLFGFTRQRHHHLLREYYRHATAAVRITTITIR